MLSAGDAAMITSFKNIMKKLVESRYYGSSTKENVVPDHEEGQLPFSAGRLRGLLSERRSQSYSGGHRRCVLWRIDLLHVQTFASVLANTFEELTKARLSKKTSLSMICRIV